MQSFLEADETPTFISQHKYGNYQNEEKDTRNSGYCRDYEGRKKEDRSAGKSNLTQCERNDRCMGNK